MSYIPANPHFAIVNCKIGDLNLTPIPPNSLESFTYERDTNQGAGNKFTIVVHDETAIVMESYLAETAFKAMNAEGYEFEGGLTNVYKEGSSGTTEGSGSTSGSSSSSANQDINKKPNPESTLTQHDPDRYNNRNESSDEPKAQLMSISSFDEIPTFYDSSVTTPYIGTYDARNSNDDLVIGRDESNHAALRMRNIQSNESAFSSSDMDTNLVTGSSGVYVTENTSPIYGNTSREPVIPNIIDDEKLHYADPSTGIRELFGFKVNDEVWMSEKAIAEFSDGSDPNDPES